MYDLILKYLNKHYVFTLSTHDSYLLKEITSNEKVRMVDVLKNVMLIFDISEPDLTIIFDEWADQQAIIINNKITDIRYEIYAKTGVELQMTPEDLNKLIAYDSFKEGFKDI